MTHTYMDTQGHKQTEGCFLWLQNIRSRPQPKCQSYHQCGSEGRILIFLFRDSRYFLLVFCDVLSVVLQTNINIYIYGFFCVIWCPFFPKWSFRHVYPAAGSSGTCSILLYTGVLLCVFCNTAVITAYVVRAAIQ